MRCRDHPSLWAFLFMAMNNEIEKKIRERYLQCDSKFFDKFVEQNQDVKQELELILSINPWFETIRNVYVAWNHGIYDTVKCKYCGKPLKVENAIYGKHFYCSKKCADADPRTSELRKKTCLEKYGTSTPLLNEECKKKTVATCREKFGNDMFAGSDEYKRRVPSPFGKKEVQDKSRQTKIERHGEDFGKVIFEEKVKDSMIKRNMERYGVPYVLMNKEKADETHRTMKERYGDEYFWRTSSNNDIKMDIGFSRIGNWSDYVIPLFTREEYDGHNHEYSWRCVRCGHEFIQRIYTTGLGKDRMVPRCEKCFPKSTCSIAEKEVLDFVKSIYNGRIIENNQTVLENRLELDIYIPDKKVAIEFDGLYWHSEENGKDSGYHLNKTVECEKNGIRLIHVFEDEWRFQRPIVEDRLKSILGVGQKSIFARKCVVKAIGAKESNEFLEHNHIQGADGAPIRYGLFYNGELVAVMTFGKPRFSRGYDYELIRFASKLGTHVVGGASKLLACFSRLNSGSIVSYADRRYSDGNLYRKLGFRLKNISQPNYWYVKNCDKLSRYACQKHKLPALLGDGFNPEWSESENMAQNGWNRIYDCGNFVFVKD